MITQSIQGGLGVSGRPVKPRFIVRGTTAVRGNVLALDFANATSGVSNNLPGDTASGMVNLVIPTSAHALGEGILAVVSDDSVVDGGKCYAELMGLIDRVSVFASSGSLTKGTAMCAVSGGKYLIAKSAAAVGARVIGILQDDVTTPNPAKPARVMFQGVNGLTVKAS